MKERVGGHRLSGGKQMQIMILQVLEKGKERDGAIARGNHFSFSSIGA